MEPYRIKHKATGLYYKPGHINLSKKGKVYTSNASVLSGAESVGCRVSKIKSTPEQLEALKESATNTYEYGSEIMFVIPVAEFEKVEVTDEQETEILFYDNHTHEGRWATRMVKVNKSVPYIVVQLLCEQVQGIGCVRIRGSQAGSEFNVTQAHQMTNGRWKKLKLEHTKIYF